MCITCKHVPNTIELTQALLKRNNITQKPNWIFIKQNVVRRISTDSWMATFQDSAIMIKKSYILGVFLWFGHQRGVTVLAVSRHHKLINIPVTSIIGSRVTIPPITCERNYLMNHLMKLNCDFVFVLGWSAHRFVVQGWDWEYQCGKFNIAPSY